MAENKKYELESIYRAEDKDLYVEATYMKSKDTVKPGEGLDMFSIICGVMALACGGYMVYAGVTSYFTLTMKFLLVVYSLIAIWCFVKPLQNAVSKAMWKSSIKSRFPVNHGIRSTIFLGDVNMSYFDAKGVPEAVNYDDMHDIYEDEKYIYIHIDDKRIFLLEKEMLDEQGVLDDVINLLSNDNQTDEEALDSTAVAEENTAAEETVPEESKTVEEAPVAEASEEAAETTVSANDIPIVDISSKEISMDEIFASLGNVTADIMEIPETAEEVNGEAVEDETINTADIDATTEDEEDFKIDLDDL